MERKFRITVDGRAYNVTVEDLSEGSNLLYPQPGSMSLPSAPAAAPAATSAAGQTEAATQASAGAGNVVATLGGVVESVAVSVGQAVNKGDSVVILDAMKMKCPMTAPRSGTVTSVAVKAGDAVEVGRVLATIS